MGDALEIGGYLVRRKLGYGGYGEIYAVQSKADDKMYAMKTENVETQQRGIADEISILKSLPQEKYFSKVIDQGSTGAIKYFVMPMYGPSIAAIKKECDGQRFSIPTALRTGLEMLKIIESLHNSGYVHGDIKPSNFLLREPNSKQLVLIDYGLSSKYIENGKVQSGQIIDGFKGTIKYASVSVHRLFEPCRQDDLISWFYSMIELSRGTLPWSDIHDKNLVMSNKQSISIEKLCHGLPPELIEIWSTIHSRGPAATPDYSRIESLLTQAINNLDQTGSIQLDWESNPTIIKKITPFTGLFDEGFDEDLNFPEEEEEKRECCCVIA